MSTKLLPFQPIFCRVFPHNLKYTFRPQNFQRKLLFTRVKDPSPVLFCVSKFSTRPGRERMGTGSGPGPGPGLRAGSSKSLIEDEADLSDWVSGLSSNSFNKTRVYSDSENDEGGNVEKREFRGRESSDRRSRDGGFGRDSEFSSRRGGAGGRGSGGYGPPRGQGGGRGTGRPFSERRESDKDFGRRDRGYDKSESFPRRRDSESDSFSGRDRGYDKSDSFPRRRSENDSNGNVFSGRGRGGAGRGGRGGNRGEPFLGRRTSESGFDGNSSSGGGRGRDSSEFRRGGKFEGRLEEKRKSVDGILSRGNEGRRGEKWGERGVEMRNQDGSNRGSDRGMGMKRGEKVTGQRGLVVTDDENVEEEEEEGKAYMNFKELISTDEDENDDDEDVAEEDETDDKEENDEGSDMLLENGSVSFESTKSSAGQNDSYLSESRFDQCSISPLSLKAIKDAGYEKMTLVQEATLPLILKGKDVLAKAKTGTGKTVAFLLPAIEQVVKLPSSARDEKRPPILVLVICPTRELASQAAAEANKLLKYHPSIGVQVVIGGTRLALEQKRMQANPCQILVATPGRLRDHVENTAAFATRLMGVKTLVLDEADHLLDMGFRKDIEKIIAAVPKQRQTLLFSATIPPEVRQISHIALKRDHEFINTVQEGSEDTHSQVRQTHLVAPLDKHFPLLYTMLKDHIADDVSYKILVFCTTAMVTKLVASLLGELNMNVREIHSRKPQSYRTRVSDEFRKSKGLILVTSDVSARGVDYPDVTLVVQMGVPSDRQQYIHRLGRTGRKGKEGQGILMLAPWEEFFLSNIKDLPISKSTEPLVDPNTRKKIERALSNVEMKNKESAYQAWLGYYNSNRNIGRDKTRLVELANEFSKSMGLDNPPAIPKLVLGKMGLKNVPGLRSK